MPFKKGKSGNPNGRPVGAKSKWKKRLEKAISDAEVRNNQKIFDRLLDMAWKDKTLMAVVLKKLVPDIRHFDHNIITHKTHDEWVKAIQEKFTDGVDEKKSSRTKKKTTK